MILLEVLVVLALVALALYVLLGRRAPEPEWRVVTRTREDGTLVVAVASRAGGERVVRELPPAVEGVELASDLRLAREEAQLQADELNR
jgi:hypothetical protein